MQSTLIVSAFLVASLVPLLAASSQPLDKLDEELLGLELSDPWLSEHLEEHHVRHHHHGHHHHGHRRFRGLRMPRLRSHRASLAVAEPAKVQSKSEPPKAADGQAGAEPRILAARHPAVDRVLSSMDGEMQELRAKKQAAGNARGRLQDMVADATLHMNDALTLKHEMAQKEAKLEAQQERLKALEASEGRLERTHEKLGTSLHHIMEPKIQSAEARFQNKEAVVQKMREDVDTWQEKTESYKASALQLLEDRKVAKEGLEESEEALAAAQRDEENAEKNLKLTSKRAEEEVEAYRYVANKYNAAHSRAMEGDDEIHQAEKSVQKLRGILDMEQNRIDQAMAIGKDKLQGKIRKLENNEEKETKELEALKKEYSEWQNHERGRVEQVAQAEATTKQLTNAFHDQQDQVLDAASDKVVKQAVEGSDWGWDGWPTAQNDDYNIDLGDSM